MRELHGIWETEKRDPEIFAKRTVGILYGGLIQGDHDQMNDAASYWIEKLDRFPPREFWSDQQRRDYFMIECFARHTYEFLSAIYDRVVFRSIYELIRHDQE